MKNISIILLLSLSELFCLGQSPIDQTSDEHSPARIWMDMYLEAIRKDGLGPTIHARNMYHISAAMYDAWLVYNPDKGEPLFLGKTINGFEIPFEGFETPENKDSAMNISITYAAFQLMRFRFNEYSSKPRVMDDFIFKMEEMGLKSNYYSTDYKTGSPAALGTYIATKMYEFGLSEPAGDDSSYEGWGSNPVNLPLKPNEAGNKHLNNCNRWQPLSLWDYINKRGWDSTLIDWNFLLIQQVDEFLTPHWGLVTPFAMGEKERTVINSPRREFIVYNDPGPPPLITDDPITNKLEEYRWNFTLVSSWSGHNDPNDETLIDISPGALGPTNGLMPSSFEE